MIVHRSCVRWKDVKDVLDMLDMLDTLLMDKSERSAPSMRAVGMILDMLSTTQCFHYHHHPIHYAS